MHVSLDLRLELRLGWCIWIDDEICKDIDLDFSRYLYDFFDDNGIYVSIEHEEDFQVAEKLHWSYRIEGRNINETVGSDMTVINTKFNHFANLNAKNRKESETTAFNKAFEILEEQLKEKK